jgi:nucleoside-diphosphate-sugar epimerase
MPKTESKIKKVIVTGGAGFIGSHLTDALINEGYSVMVIDNLFTGKRSQVNKAAKFVKVDICDLKKIKPYFKGVELVFHLAAMARIQPSIKDPAPAMNNNVLGTLNVLLASRDNGIKKVIYSGSSSSYGDQETLPLYEEMLPHFKNPYALSKYVGEELCRLFYNLYGLQTVSLRYFNVYGPRQLSSGAYATAVGIFLKQLGLGQPLTITGDGNSRRDFTHVFDVAKANIAAAKSAKVGKGDLINIGTGKNYSINEVAAMILSQNVQKYDGGFQIKAAAVFDSEQPEAILASALKNGLAAYIPALPGETRRTLANNSKARQLLGWKPTITLEEGLAMLKN